MNLPQPKQVIPPNKPLLYLSSQPRTQKVFKRCMMKNYKFHKIHKLDQGLLRKSSLYTKRDCKKYFLSQKHLTFFGLFPTTKTCETSIPSRVFSNVKEMKNFAFTKGQPRSLYPKPNTLKKLQSLTCLVNYMKVKTQYKFYSRSLVHLNLVILATKEGDLTKVIRLFRKNFPCLKTLYLRYRFEKQIEKLSARCNQDFWRELKQYKKLESVKINPLNCYEYNDIFSMLPENDPKYNLSFQLEAFLIERCLINQVEEIAHKLNCFQNCTIIILFKWDQMPYFLMEKLLAFLGKIHHKVKFLAQQPNTIGRQSTWIYELLDKAILYKDKILSWNGILSADTIDECKIGSILHHKEKFEGLEIECYRPIGVENIGPKLELFKSIAFLKNLKDIVITLYIEPVYDNTDWNLNNFFDMIDNFARGLRDFKGNLDLRLWFKDDLLLSSLYGGFTEEKLNTVWKVLEKIKRHLTKLGIFLNGMKTPKALKMAKEMFKVIKSCENMEQIQIESKFDIEGLEEIEGYFCEVSKSCKKLKGFSLKNEIAVGYVDAALMDILAKTCEGFKEKMVRNMSSPYIWVDSSVSITLVD